MLGFAIVLSFLLVGVILQRVPALPISTARWLTRYVLNVAVPAMVLLHLAQLTVDATIWVPVLTPWAMLIGSMLMVFLLTKWFGWSRQVMGALLIVVPLGNTSFLGFPIISSFYGNEGLAYAVLYDQFGSFIGLAVIATTLAAIFGRPLNGAGMTPSARGIALKILSFPPFIALVLALLVLASEVTYPVWFASALAILGMTLVPAVMVAVGLQLRLRVPREDVGPFVASLLLKLVILPALAFLTMWGLGLDGLAVKVSLLEAAMPPMITAGAIAIAAGLRTTLVAAIIGYGVLLSVLTLPVWYWLIELVFN
ncbi:hypothetical protein CWE12_05370 [Aliidiomarina sedimenti]|uniref:AEC family transporter n=1 Tax=Aliidiomarina sedimenti TaxID=1933879 RepID=A0ABY0BZX3_9GAMM|nr:AEC family transporter [Aliidiomarina sedimenti]RUO30675.1 hypothetical protein CWE12_05370 [Aliidiomarina sedimenti]